MLESEKIDYKEKFGDNTLKALCAFANTDGGTVVVGVLDDGEEKSLFEKTGKGKNTYYTLKVGE